MIHQVLPCKKRFLPIHLRRASCEEKVNQSPYSLDLTSIYDSSITQEKMVRLKINCEALYELPTTCVLCSGLELIWRNRHDRKSSRLDDIRGELECLVLKLRNSRPRNIMEASNIIRKMKISRLICFLFKYFR
jgi:hypothetical protein